MSDPKRWNDACLDAARMIGDPELDNTLIPQLFGESLVSKKSTKSKKLKGYQTNRLKFNLLLDIATKMLDDPELAFTEGSEMKELMDAAPQQFVNYFDPIEAPDWVDEEKIRIAADLWQANSFPILFTLGAASLPFCYMIQKAIPTLYDTRKLEDPKYMNQRIYETGVFLDAVLSPGGIKVIEDFSAMDDVYWQKALEMVDPDGQWEVADGRMIRTDKKGKKGAGAAPDLQTIHEKAEQLKAEDRTRRYIWGRGFINARKVRFLHATMRHMLLKPQSVKPNKPKEKTFSCPMEAHQNATAPFDVEKNGIPINQEDTSYTLMTFSLVLYQALEYFGRTVTDEQKDALLHVWKVIGHIMGIEEKYMTDDQAEAEALFRRVQERHAERSEVGVDLNDAVLNWMGTLLPRIMGSEKHVPTILCERLLGNQLAPLVISEERSSPPSLWGKIQLMGWRFGMAMAMLILRFCYWMADHVFCYFHYATEMNHRLLHRTASELIGSFRGPWLRKVFWLPVNPTTWKRKKGATPEFQEKLDNWRRRVMGTITVAIVFLGLGTFAFAGWMLFFLVEFKHKYLDHLDEPLTDVGMWLFIFCVVAYLFTTLELFPRVLRKRPVIDDTALADSESTNS